MNDPSPDTHVFIGMFRPEWKAIEDKNGFNRVIGPGEDAAAVCSYLHRQASETREKWIAGHFDTPVYARREEILDRMARGNTIRS